MHQGLKTHRRKPRRNANHVGLGNATVNGTVRIGLRPLGRADAAHKIGVQINKVGILSRQGGNHGAQNVFAHLGVVFTFIYNLHDFFLLMPARAAFLSVPQSSGRSRRA